MVAEAYTVGDVSGMGLIDKAVQEATAVGFILLLIGFILQGISIAYFNAD